jgi:purple acid phosphatase-like protein
MLTEVILKRSTGAVIILLLVVAIVLYAFGALGNTIIWTHTVTSTNTAVISWQTKTIGNSKVWYAPSGTTAYSNVSDGTPVKYHSITVTGLTPGTAYSYRVASSYGGKTISSGYQTFTTIEKLVLSGYVCNMTNDPNGTTRTLTCNLTTNLPTTSMLKYGMDMNYGTQVPDNTLATSHVISATGLRLDTYYCWEVQSTSADGQMVDPEGEVK